MEMSIDKAINEIWHCIVSIRDCVGNKKFVEALQTAIDTMRKYQQIQEIVKQKDYDRFNSHNYYGDFLRVQDIRKVL